jgi:hypothetical protein
MGEGVSADAWRGQPISLIERKAHSQGQQNIEPQAGSTKMLLSRLFPLSVVMARDLVRVLIQWRKLRRARNNMVFADGIRIDAVPLPPSRLILLGAFADPVSLLPGMIER